VEKPSKAPAKRETPLHFDDAVSSELAKAREDARHRTSYVENLFRELKATNQGDIRYLGDVRYDDGTEFRKFWSGFAKRLGHKISVLPNRGAYMQTIYAAYEEFNESIFCFVKDKAFEPLNVQGRRYQFTDADLRWAVAHHEAHHARLRIEGYPLSLESPDEVQGRFGGKVRYELEELLCVHHELREFLRGNAEASHMGYLARVAMFGYQRNLVAGWIADPALKPLVREAISYTGDLLQIPEAPYLRLEHK